jgi:hypothetical protein
LSFLPCEYFLQCIGRVTTDGIIKPGATAPKMTSTTTTFTPLRPDEVLFRSHKAPERFEENDIYWANEKLSPDQKLPDSDLLKALHKYASEFYGSMKDNRKDWRSLDETALLALGILLEEAAVEILGPTGDLTFTEAENHDEDYFKQTKVWNGKTWVPSVIAKNKKKRKEN